jgi:hypothetical protein
VAKAAGKILVHGQFGVEDLKLDPESRLDCRDPVSLTSRRLEPGLRALLPQPEFS